jgi:hypothetical protein
MQLTPFTPDEGMLDSLRTDERHLFVVEPDESFHVGDRALDDDARVAESIARIARGSLVGAMRETPNMPRDSSGIRDRFASLLADDLGVSKAAAKKLATWIVGRLSVAVWTELRSVLTRPTLPLRGTVATLEDATEQTRKRVEQQIAAMASGENVSRGRAR